MTTEVVLPSGSFARVRVIQVGDMLFASKSNSPLEHLILLASRCCLVDDQPLTVEEWLSLPYADLTPVAELINKQLLNAFQTREGIA